MLIIANDGVRAKIARMKKDVADGIMIDASSILQKYIDIGDYVHSEDGYLFMLNPLDEVDTSIISELSNTENGPKLKLADKMKALDMLAKYTDLLSNDDKKRLQEEKLKADITKAQADADKANDEDKTIEIMITRKKRSEDDD